MTRGVLAAAIGCCVSASASATDYFLYFMGGQSNMAGYGTVAELPEAWTGPVEGAVIFNGNTAKDGEPSTGAGVWAPVTPGHGMDVRTEAGILKLGARMGPELAFAARMRELRPGERVAIIKYARNGSSLDVRAAAPEWGTWDPHDRRGEGGLGINQYDHALAAIEAATAVRDLDGDGEADRLIPAGLVWMQGESDAMTLEIASAYAENLAEMAELLRSALRRDELPFVFGRISDSQKGKGTPPRWPFGEEIRAQQAAFAAADPRAVMVTSTDEYGYSDTSHYDTAGYLSLGAAFAEAMDKARGAAAP